MLKSFENALRGMPITLGVLLLASCSASDQPLEPEDDDEVVESGSFRVLTYNIQIAAFGTDFRTVRLPLIKESIEQNEPDFIGFQEAYSAHGSSQQSDLAAAFAGTRWTTLRWDDPNENNKNPIGLKTDRYALVASGVIVLDLVEGIGACTMRRTSGDSTVIPGVRAKWTTSRSSPMSSTSPSDGCPGESQRKRQG